MKTIKRTVAALLATLMLATSTSFTALAAETYTNDESVVVAKVSGAGIMTGTDKGFEPSKSLTRAEAAAIIVRMKGISESAVKTMAGTTLFNDVAASHWASGYVNQASNLGIVKGVSATEFAPDREVTIAEFVTMAVRALGAGQLVDSEGTWPTNYVNFANENDILKDVTAVYTAVSTRMNAATIVANTLEAPMWEKTGVKSNGEIEWSKSIIGYSGKDAIYRTILKNVLDIDVYEDGAISDIDIKDRKLTWTENVETNADELKNKNVAAGVELATIKAVVAYNVWYQTKTKEIVAVYETEDSKSTTVEFDGIDKIDTNKNKITVIEDGDEVKYSLTVDADTDAITTVVILNGDEEEDDLLDIADLNALGEDKLDATFGSLVLKDNKVAAIYAYRYTDIAKVKEVDDTKVKFEALKANTFDSNLDTLASARSIKFDAEDIVLYITKNSKEIKLEDLEKDDILVMYADADEDDETLYINVLDNEIEGTVDSVSKDSYIKVDGKKYTLSAGLKGNENLPSPKDEVKLFFNAKEEVVAFDSVEATSEYAVIKSLKAVNTKDGLDLEVQLAYSDGTVSNALVLDLDVKEEKFGYDLSAAVDGILTGNAKDINDSIKAGSFGTVEVGDIVKYQIKGDKLAIEAVAAGTADAKGYLALDGFKAGKSKSYFTSGDANVYVTDSTDVIIVKFMDDANDTKVSKVEISDLNTDTYNSNYAYAIGVKSTATSASFVVLFEDDDNKASRTNKSDDWMMVLAKADIDDGDYDEEYTLVDANGKETIVSAEELEQGLGTLGLVAISGDELTEAIDDAEYPVKTAASDDFKKDTTASDAIYLNKVEDGVAYFVGTASNAKNKEVSYVLGDKVLYIEANAATPTELKVSKLSKIDKVDPSDITATTLSSATKIAKIYLEEVDSDEGIYEVVAIMYIK